MTMYRRTAAPNEGSRRPGAGRFFLMVAAIAIAVSGLFPPWFYTVYQTGTRDNTGYRSQKSAGYHFLLRPPPPELDDHPAFGVKLDGERLLIEWVCIVAAATAAWTIAGMSPRHVSEAGQEELAGGREPKAKISGEATALVAFGILVFVVFAYGLLNAALH